MKKNRLNVKDLITIGVLNTIAIVCYFLAVVLSCMTIVGLFYSTAVAFVVMGTIYMLIALKVHKKGTFFLCGAIMSLVGLFGGRIYTTVGCLVGGLLAELIVGEYKKFKRIAIAYAGFAVSVAAGIYLPAFLMGTDYLLSRGSERGMTAETVQMYAKYYNTTTLLLVLALNVVAALIGAGIGRVILKKHFVKAGIVKTEKRYKVFPWWKARLFSGIQALRRKRQNPEKILDTYIKPGDSVADIGCGMGYFTIPMAQMTGKDGNVVAVDLQEQMLKGLRQKMEKAGCTRTVTVHQCEAFSLRMGQWKETFDFVLLFAVAHEVPNRMDLFQEISEILKPGGLVLFAEPIGHVSKECFEESKRYAAMHGLEIVSEEQVPTSRAVLLRKKV